MAGSKDRVVFSLLTALALAGCSGGRNGRIVAEPVVVDDVPTEPDCRSEGDQDREVVKVASFELIPGKDSSCLVSLYDSKEKTIYLRFDPTYVQVEVFYKGDGQIEILAEGEGPTVRQPFKFDLPELKGIVKVNMLGKYLLWYSKKF